MTAPDLVATQCLDDIVHGIQSTGSLGFWLLVLNHIKDNAILGHLKHNNSGTCIRLLQIVHHTQRDHQVLCQ